MSGALNWDVEITKNNFKIINDAERKNKSRGKASNDSDGNKPPFKLVPVRDLIASPRKFSWAIKGIYELGGMSLVSGAYGSFKSFLAYEQAFCVAAGIDWHGHKVIQMPVVILMGEGLSGAADRFEALAIHYGIEVPACLYVSEVAAELTDGTNAEWVGDAVNALCPEAGMVIVDTLNRNFGLGDENSSKDMSAFVSNVDAVFRNSGKTIIPIHHSGWGAERGRGSTVLPAACEAEYFIKKQSDGLVLNCTKQKNAPEHEPIHFKTKTVVLPGRFDDEGEAVSSLVLEMTNDVGGSIFSNKQTSLSGNQKIVFDALAVIFNNQSIVCDKPVGISLSDATDKTRTSIPCEPKRQSERAKLAINALVSKGLLRFDGELLFPS